MIQISWELWFGLALLVAMIIWFIVDYRREV